jgi:hypothetical protein
MIGGEYREVHCRAKSQWPRDLRRGSAAACLLRLWVRIAPRAWMSVCCDCCVVSGRGFCVGLITSTEKSYRVCVCVSKCDHEALKMRRLFPTGGLLRHVKHYWRWKRKELTDVLRVPVNGTCVRGFSVADSVVSHTVWSSAVTELPVQGQFMQRKLYNWGQLC